MDKDVSRKRKSIDSLNKDDAPNCSKKVHKSATKDEEIIGIPNEKLEEYKRIRKIKEFYPWQLEFMNDPRLINGENALLTAETGGGKTLVAELLIIRTMVTKGCSAILALPYVALVSEKVPIFKALSEVFDITVKEYAGLIHTYPIPPPNNTLYICSYEFATIVCTRLKEADQLKEIKLLVLDEIHMVGEALRGANVEMLLAGYRILIEDQIIAMSATVGNIQQLTKWVAGFHYHSPLRPVPLQEHIVYSGRVLSVKGDQLAIERVLNPQLPWYSELAFEIVPEHSVLMFCNSRKACEDTCSILCRTVPRDLEMHKCEERNEFVDNLIIACKNDGKPLPFNLQKGLENGIAFHHAKISMLQRKAIEQGFRNGIISIICSTTTLAAGVNLPVRRVIMKTAKVGWNIMNKTYYLQMAGRAGRMGLDDVGECFILADEDYGRVTNLVLKDPVPECESRLEKKLETFVYKFVSLGHNTEDKLKNAMSLTLFNHQKPNEILEQKIIDLKEPEFLHENSENELSLSPIAFVARFLRLMPRKLLIIIEHFSTFKNSVFSIIAYCIPSGIGKYMNVNAEVFRNEYLKLDDMDKQIFENILYYKNMLISLFNGVTPARLKHCSRFYAAMMILRLFQDKMKDVQCAEMFDVQKEVLCDICKNVCLELKRLKRAAAYLQEMAALRKPVSDLLVFLEKYSKDF